MTTPKYNKSEIMRDAHRRYNSTDNKSSFSYCLSMAWFDAKSKVYRAAAEAERMRKEAIRKEADAYWTKRFEGRTGSYTFTTCNNSGCAGDYGRGNGAYLGD
jgi:hypothetical protein